MLATAFILGLLGSFHCVGMCGPIAFLLPLDRYSRVRRYFEVASYQTGRLLTYGLIGVLFGLVGKRLQLFGLQQQLSIAIGILMILAIILPVKILGKYSFSKPIYRLVSKLKTAIGFELKRKKPGTFITMGFLNGLLPCGFVYLAVFGALGIGDIWKGGLYMIFFGLGTIPLMTTAIYLGNFLNNKIKQRILKAIPVFVVIIGLLFILRGMGLDILYLSPSQMVAVEQVSANHRCH